MAKRKFTRNGERPKAYQCTKQKCKWQGTDEERGMRSLGNDFSELICPKCGNNEFYGLLEVPTWYNEEQTTKRMNIIGQNGNDGEHY